jgi:hypothetical protein
VAGYGLRMLDLALPLPLTLPAHPHTYRHMSEGQNGSKRFVLELGPELAARVEAFRAGQPVAVTRTAVLRFLIGKSLDWFEASLETERSDA